MSATNSPRLSAAGEKDHGTMWLGNCGLFVATPGTLEASEKAEYQRENVTGEPGKSGTDEAIGE